MELTLDVGDSCALSRGQTRHLCPSPQTKRWTSRHGDCHQAGRECWVRRLQVCWAYWTLTCMTDNGEQDRQWWQTTSPSLSPPGTSTTIESQQSEHLLIHLSIHQSNNLEEFCQSFHWSSSYLQISPDCSTWQWPQSLFWEGTQTINLHLQGFAVYNLGHRLP